MKKKYLPEYIEYKYKIKYNILSVFKLFYREYYYTYPAVSIYSLHLRYTIHIIACNRVWYKKLVGIAHEVDYNFSKRLYIHS